MQNKVHSNSKANHVGRSTHSMIWQDIMYNVRRVKVHEILYTFLYGFSCHVYVFAFLLFVQRFFAALSRSRRREEGSEL